MIAVLLLLQTRNLWNAHCCEYDLSSRARFNEDLEVAAGRGFPFKPVSNAERAATEVPPDWSKSLADKVLPPWVRGRLAFGAMSFEHPALHSCAQFACDQ